MKVTRRTFLSLATSALASCRFTTSARPKTFSGELKGAKFQFGHLLKDGKLPEPCFEDKTDIVIAGGGIAGLSAALELSRKKTPNVTLFELDSEPGGNSISGKNEVSGYPWGAHYVPLPGAEASEIVSFFEEMGIVTGYDTNKKPLYDPIHICFEPEERLFIHGRWQEGLLPKLGINDDDQKQYDRFFSQIKKLRDSFGADGNKPFCVPLERSSKDPEYLMLDQFTFEEYLIAEGYNSKPLLWYLNYCCRDDYGAGIKKVSAWAGLHYFASRSPYASGIAGYAHVTWPEGNGWLVKKIQERISCTIKSKTVVFKIEEFSGGYAVYHFNTQTKKVSRTKCRKLICALPPFVLKYVASFLPPNILQNEIEFAPWMVANVTLDGIPADSTLGVPWDSVLYLGKGLGYVSATHQTLKQTEAPTVWTYYLPLDDLTPAEARLNALGTPLETWQQIVINELSHAHPDIASHIRNIDVWVWGHGMSIPTRGFLSRTTPPRYGGISFAHSGWSGISIFEEAYLQGLNAAREVLT